MIYILKRNKRIEIENLLKKNFDLEIPFKFQLIKAGKDKIRIFTGNLGKQDLIILDKILTIDTLGLYFAFFKDQDFRLSFDSAIVFGKNIKNTKKIIELNDSETKKWLQGQDIEKETQEKGFFIIKNNNNILGCGKATGKKILNFVPKERRIM